MRVTRCFSFDPERDKEILKHIDESKNRSAEVRDLFKAKLGMSDNDDMVNKIVQGVISQLGSPLPKKEVLNVDTEDINNIMNIVNMK